MSIENRLHPRFPIRVPLFINVEGRVFKKKLRLHSRDISAGGLSFTTRQKLPIDARSKVIIGKLGDFLESAHIEGMVVYLRRDREHEAVRGGRRVHAVRGRRTAGARATG